MSFYAMYPDPNKQILVSLDQMAKELGVERRRIYDIVNVLESVEILSRFCKNQYIWHGFNQITCTLSKLKVNYKLIISGNVFKERIKLPSKK